MRCLITLLILIFSCNAIALEIMSRDFDNGEYIPAKCAYDKSNIPPSLYWKDVPEGTKSLAIICDDPDAPSKVWVHWVMFNIKPDIDGSGVQGINDFGKMGYGGPCPPPGKPHRYFFRLYALGTILPLKKGASRDKLLSAMEGHILAEAEVMGLYQR